MSKAPIKSLKKVHPNGSTEFRRAYRLLLVCLAAAGLGVFLAIQFGYGFRPGRPVTITDVGQIEVVRLPTDARTITELSSLSITLSKPDDFAKVYLNNFLVRSSEDPESLYYSTRKEEEAKKASRRFGVLRNLNPTAHDLDIVNLVVAGWNFIVVELENSFYGECSASIDIDVNGKRLERFPRTFPKNEYAEISVVNEKLLHKFASVRSPLVNALCGRRIFAFYVRG